MNCQEVQPALSEYLEKSLDVVRMKAIETHLLSCSACRTEADGLIDCIQQVAALALVDPPMGFTQRVMAHVGEIEAQPSWWQRAIASLRISAPIQATAVVFIAVLAVFLYQKESQVRNDETSQLTTPIPPMSFSFDKNSSTADQPSAESPLPAAKGEVSKNTAGQAPVAEARRKITPESPSLKEQTPARGTAIAHLEDTAGDVKNPLPRRAPIQAQEVATGLENLRPSGDTFGIGPTLGSSLRQDFFLPERGISPITEPSADVEFIVRRRDNQKSDQKENARSDSLRQRTESSIASAAVAKQANPQAVSPQANRASVSEVRWFAVPADRYDQFRKELVAEASIESEKTLGALEKDSTLASNRDLLIKVIVLAPAER